MNFFAMPTLKNVRACFRLPISMMPRLALKLTLARLRTGIDRVGSLLRSAAVITASATLMSFFSTAPIFFTLAFAIATEVNPDILLIDEILAVGDGEFRRKCFERIEQFRTRGKTILFVSHDLTAIHQFSDRTLLLHGGELIEDGSPDFVISRYKALLEKQVDTLRTKAWS